MKEIIKHIESFKADKSKNYYNCCPGYEHAIDDVVNYLNETFAEVKLTDMIEMLNAKKVEKFDDSIVLTVTKSTGIIIYNAKVRVTDNKIDTIFDPDLILPKVLYHLWIADTTVIIDVPSDDFDNMRYKRKRW